MPTTQAFRLTSPKAGSFIQSAADEWGASDAALYRDLENERTRQTLNYKSEQLWAALNRKRQRCKTSAALSSAASTFTIAETDTAGTIVGRLAFDPYAPATIDGAELPALLADLPPVKDEFLPQKVNRGERK